MGHLSLFQRARCVSFMGRSLGNGICAALRLRKEKGGEEHGGLSAEFRCDPWNKHIALDLRPVFHSAYLREILRAGSARLLRCGKVQAAGGVDVYRLRDRDISRHRADFRDPAGRGGRTRLRASLGRRRGGLESDKGQVALEYWRL